jgi:hypothetical protein
MTAPTETTLSITVPARAAAIAWLNTFLASSQDKERPILCRTMSLEWFDSGVQFVCTDGTALFRCWVPSVEDADASWPHKHRPTQSVVVMDPDGFGIGFMRALLRVTGEEAHAGETLTLSLSPHDDAPEIALGAEFMTERVTLRACGQRIDLRLFDAEYPDWRNLKLDVIPVERVEGMLIATRLYGLLGKLRGVASAELEFHGDNRFIAFTAKGEAPVRGLLMPMRRVMAEPEKPPAENPDAPSLGVDDVDAWVSRGPWGVRTRDGKPGSSEWEVFKDDPEGVARAFSEQFATLDKAREMAAEFNRVEAAKASA